MGGDEDGKLDSQGICNEVVEVGDGVDVDVGSDKTPMLPDGSEVVALDWLDVLIERLEVEVAMIAKLEARKVTILHSTLTRASKRYELSNKNKRNKGNAKTTANMVGLGL